MVPVLAHDSYEEGSTCQQRDDRATTEAESVCADLHALLRDAAETGVKVPELEASIPSLAAFTQKV